jgi:hypothetical protein
MQRLSSKLRINKRGMLMFWCPACNVSHGVMVDDPGTPDWNGDVDNPTITPDVTVTALDPLTAYEATRAAKGEEIERCTHICRFRLTAGQVEFLDGSEHDYVGVTMPLPDFQGDGQ